MESFKFKWFRQDLNQCKTEVVIRCNMMWTVVTWKEYVKSLNLLFSSELNGNLPKLINKLIRIYIEASVLSFHQYLCVEIDIALDSLSTHLDNQWWIILTKSYLTWSPVVNWRIPSRVYWNLHFENKIIYVWTCFFLFNLHNQIYYDRTDHKIT